MFGENVKNLRKEMNLSQEELGAYFSISGPAVSKWEAGISEPDNNTLIKLANFFGVTVDFLLGNKHKKSEDEEIEILKQLLIKKGFMKPGEDLSKKELDKLMKFVNANKEFLKGDKQ